MARQLEVRSNIQLLSQRQKRLLSGAATEDLAPLHRIRTLKNLTLRESPIAGLEPLETSDGGDLSHLLAGGQGELGRVDGLHRDIQPGQGEGDQDRQGQGRQGPTGKLFTHSIHLLGVRPGLIHYTA